MARKRKGNPVHGWVNFDKPLEMTSTQAVGKVRWLFQAQKAGHAGTLDPLATGILPIALGDATKTVSFMMDAEKSYDFTISWGISTDTCDAEGQEIASSTHRPSAEDVEAVLPDFVGTIEQVPPKYSAIKLNGQRAYDLARAGESVHIPARPVRIDALYVVSHTDRETALHVDCGKGTYVRAIARDLAQALGTCGHVCMLRRTRVGPFVEKDAFSLDDLDNLCHRGHVLDGLMPVQTALDDIPVVIATDTDANHLKHGRAAALSKNHPISVIPDSPPWVLVMHNGLALALCETDGEHLKPRRVFNL